MRIYWGGGNFPPCTGPAPFPRALNSWSRPREENHLEGEAVSQGSPQRSPHRVEDRRDRTNQGEEVIVFDKGLTKRLSANQTTFQRQRCVTGVRPPGTARLEQTAHLVQCGYEDNSLALHEKHAPQCVEGSGPQHLCNRVKASQHWKNSSENTHTRNILIKTSPVSDAYFSPLRI